MGEQRKKKTPHKQSCSTIIKIWGAHKTSTEQKVHIFCPLSSSLPQEDPSWTFVCCSQVAVLVGYLSGSSWHCTVRTVLWTTGSVSYLGIQFIISDLVSKSPTDRFCLASCSPSLERCPLTPLLSIPTSHHNLLLGNCSFIPAPVPGPMH